MAKKRKDDHVVVRNGHPFCTNCGASYEINLPAPIPVVTGAIDGFIKAHRACEKTWTQPVPEISANTVERMTFWLANGERGTSSETMFSILAQKIPGAPQLDPKWGPSHPLDPDDFRRCHLLLECVPDFRTMLDHMKDVSPVWAKLVENWDRLTEMLKEQLATDKRNGMYEFMKELGC
jgi:hypothetical protein